MFYSTNAKDWESVMALSDLYGERNWKVQLTLTLIGVWHLHRLSIIPELADNTHVYEYWPCCVAGGTQNDDETDPHCRLGCHELAFGDYVDLLWTTFAEIPGLLLNLTQLLWWSLLFLEYVIQLSVFTGRCQYSGSPVPDNCSRFACMPQKTNLAVGLNACPCYCW